MSTTAIAALERALKADDIDSIRFEIMSALGSLKQGPAVYNDITLHARLTKEIQKRGSAAAAARDFGVARQTLHAVLNGDRPCPPAILAKIGLRRVPAGRNLYREA